ncbi:4863_t:CDS:2, partial [Racocetra fulgida]
SHNCLADELMALMKTYKPGSISTSSYILQLILVVADDEIWETIIAFYEKLTVVLISEILSIRRDFAGMKEYCDVLLEWQENQLPSCSRPAVNLSHVDKNTIFPLKSLIDEGKIGNSGSLFESIKRSFGIQKDHIIDSYTASSAVMSILTYYPAPSLGTESGPSESHSKIQLWSRILADVFLHNLVRFEPIWEYHQLVPGHGGRGSAYLDFAAVVKDFEKYDREIHKDYAVVAAEASFELNRILSITPESKVPEIRMHVGLISNSGIRLGILRPFYNDDKTAISFSYDQDVVTFKLQHDNGNQNDAVLDALKLIVYLREVVCKDGLVIKDLGFNYLYTEVEKSKIHSRY